MILAFVDCFVVDGAGVGASEKLTVHELLRSNNNKRAPTRESTILRFFCLIPSP